MDGRPNLRGTTSLRNGTWKAGQGRLSALKGRNLSRGNVEDGFNKETGLDPADLLVI